MENPNYRLEAFSDGVFAIALTLLIIDIKIPQADSVHSDKELWIALAHQWPSWLAFFVSFITILISWVAHSNAFKLIAKPTSRHTYANGLLLFSIIVLPYFTGVLAEYIKTAQAKPAINLYCGFSLLLSLSWNIIQYISLYPVSIYKPHVDLKKVKKVFSYSRYGLGLYTCTFLLSFWFPVTAFAIVTLLYMVWLVLGISLKEEKMTTGAI